MHILILPSWYSLTKNDTHGSFFKEQAESLVRAGNKVGILFPEDISLKKINIFYTKQKGIKFEQENGVYTYRYRCLNWLPRTGISSIFNWKYFGIKLYREYEKKHGKPDIIHVHSMLYGGVLACFLKKEYNIPYVVTEHFSGYLSPNLNKLQKKYIKEILENANRLFTVSSFFSNKMQKNFGFEWDVLPNLVSDSFFDNMSINDEKKFTFICIGSLLKNKNQILVVRAFEKVFKNNSNVSLKIVGEGPEYNNIKEYILQNDLKNIIMTGHASRTQVKEYISHSNCLVSGSNYETFSVVLIEALAQGRPIISTDCGGPRDIVNENNGFLVPINNVESMASALELVYTKKFNSQKLAQDCYQRFGEVSVTNRILSIYNEITKYGK